MINKLINSQKLRNDLYHTSLSKQQGVVLVVSLVFLVALTAVAAAMMQNTTTDMKMSGASEEKVVAIQQAISAVDEIISNQVSPGSTNTFAAPIASFNGQDMNMMGDLTFTNVHNLFTAATLRPFQREVGCPRAKISSSFGTCNTLTIQVNRSYGRNNTSSVIVNSGIVQRLTER